MAVGICTATLLTDPMGAAPDEIRAAAQAAVDAGFTEASVWAFQLDALADSPLHVNCIEAATAWATGTPAETASEAKQLAATAERVGAERILAVTMDPTLPDMGAARENLAVVVNAAETVGAHVCVEFLPWSAIPDLATAWAFVEPLGPSAQLLIDTWHWQRQPGGPNLDLLARIPGERISFVQLCDAGPVPGGDLLTEAMSARLLPGDGVVDFAALFDCLHTIGADPFLATEVFNPGLVAHLGTGPAAAAMRDAGERVAT